MRLQIEALWLDCFCDEDVNAALANLPPDLPSTYSRCVDRIPEKARAMAAKALRWISVSEKPLHIDELREAVSFDLCDRSWKSEKIVHSRIIIGSCSNLVVQDDYDGSVRLTHPSVRSYLFGQSSALASDLCIEEEDARLQCGEECVNYLSFTDFSLQLRIPDHRRSVSSLPSPAAMVTNMPFANSFRAISRFFPPKHNVYLSKIHAIKAYVGPQRPMEESKFALLAYACAHWASHTKMMSSSSTVWTQFENLALQPVSSWQIHPWTSSGQSQSSHCHAMLSWASREAHLPLLRLLLDRGEQYRLLNFCDLPYAEDGLAALHTASRLGHVEVVKLLTKNCNVNATGPDSKTALYYAVEKGHLDVIKHLLSIQGIDISLEPARAPDKSGPALAPMVCVALSNKNNDIAKLLLLAGAKAWQYFEDNSSKMAINLVVRGGDVEILILLLESAKKFLRSFEGTMPSLDKQSFIPFDTALEVAIGTGNEEIARLILQQSEVDEKYLSPLWSHLFFLAVRYERLNMATLLVSRLREIKMTGSLISRRACFKKAMLVAVNTEKLEFLRLFVKERFAGSITAKEMLSDFENAKFDQDLLIAAASKGNEAIVRLLLKLPGMSTKYQDEHGASALLVAVQNGHRKAAEILFEYGWPIFV